MADLLLVIESRR